MLKKWSANRIVKDWKKTLAGLLWQSIILLSSAQSNQQLAEISMRDGLPTSSTRKLIELESGSVAVATDAGVFFLPNHQNNLKRISNSVGTQQCWDLHEEEGVLYVATYNDGLYVFEIVTGNLINHYSKTELPKIRRFRKINQSLYAVARTGIWRITQSGIFNVFETQKWMLPDNMPMDVFFYNNKLHVLSYPERIIYEQQPNFQWADLAISLQKMGRKINSFDFANLVSYVHKNKVYLGSENYYMVMDSAYHFQRYDLPPKHNETWAFWDFRAHNGIVYGAVTNTNDFEDGFLHIHQPAIHTYIPPHQNPIWSITPSRFKDAIWLSTENKGVLFLQQPRGLSAAKLHFDKKFATENFLIGISDDDVEIQSLKLSNQWTSHQINDRIRSVLEINHLLYLFGADFLWIFNPITNQISKSIRTHEYQWMTSIGPKIYFFEPYNNICIFNTKTDKLARETSIEAKSDGVISQKNYIIFHKFGKGFGCIDANENYHDFTCDKPFNQYTLQFQISGEQLLIQNGNTVEIYHIDFKRFKLKYIGSINLTFPFLDIQFFKITGTQNGFHLFSGDYIFTVRFFQSSKQIELIQQQYLGPWNTNIWLYSNGNQFVLDRGDAIQVVNQSKKSFAQFQTYYSNDNNNKFPLKGLLIVNQNKNFQIISVGSNYFDIHRSLFEINLLNIGNSSSEAFFFTGNRYRWINAINVGQFKLTVTSQSSKSSHFIWSNLIFYKDLPFWFIVLFFLILLFLYINSQTKTKGKLNRRIVTLQLKTLQNNFNPHFIYNCMSLIQSLIIGNQQKKAIEVTAKLAKLNRNFLENSNNELISLHDEITFIKEYVDMEKMRFESDTNFQFQIHIPKTLNTKTWLIPPMILQPLIENSIKHGVLTNVGNSQIDLFLTEKDNQTIEIRIENPNPKSRKKANQGIGIGLKLVADRLAILTELHPDMFRTSFTSGMENKDKYVTRIEIERLTNSNENHSLLNTLLTDDKQKLGG
ncbi:MAG: histidine kinase [Bacteroidia bacterium]